MEFELFITFEKVRLSVSTSESLWEDHLMLATWHHCGRFLLSCQGGAVRSAFLTMSFTVK